MTHKRGASQRKLPFTNNALLLVLIAFSFIITYSHYYPDGVTGHAGTAGGAEEGNGEGEIFNCGDGICNEAENCQTCVQDCGCLPDQSCYQSGHCGPPCGDGTCDPSTENSATCPSDCYCGDAVCNPADETTCSCETDCGIQCGDTCIGTGEECDPPGSVCQGTGTCLPDCTCIGGGQNLCGNGVVDSGEQCDDGVNGDDTDQCYDDCTFTYCGDSILQNPNGNGNLETCEADTDCNIANGEYCDLPGNPSQCTCIASGGGQNLCGNGVVDPGEQCEQDSDCAIPGDMCSPVDCFCYPSCDQDYDTYQGNQCTGGNDCDDYDPYSYPGGYEFCDGVDNNCDGTIDEGCGSTYNYDPTTYTEYYPDVSADEEDYYPPEPSIEDIQIPQTQGQQQKQTEEQGVSSPIDKQAGKKEAEPSKALFIGLLVALASVIILIVLYFALTAERKPPIIISKN